MEEWFFDNYEDPAERTPYSPPKAATNGFSEDLTTLRKSLEKCLRVLFHFRGYRKSCNE